MLLESLQHPLNLVKCFRLINARVASGLGGPVGLAAMVMVIFFFASTSMHASSEDDPRGFVDSIAATVYSTAWPTATYEQVSIKSIDPAPGGYNILVKLSGKSGWGGGDLWMVVTLELRGGSLSDVRVDSHNAILSPPFAIAQALGELLVQLAEDTAESQSQSIASAESAPGYRLYVSNLCRHPIRLAVKYKTPSNQWDTVGWWEFTPNSSRYLTFRDGRFARTNSSVLYYYAESEDRSLYWGGGGTQVSLDGRTLSMNKVEDTEGDTEWSLRCD